MGYLTFLRLMKNASVVITDSGSIQAETSVLQIPCLTLRDTTEWTITVERGTNELVGLSIERLMHCLRMILSGRWKRGNLDTVWDGNTAGRCLDVILGWRDSR